MIEFETNNYKSINAAIDDETTMHRLYLAEARARVFILYSAGVGLLLLLLAIAWYIYTHAGSNSEEVHQQSSGKVNNDYTETIVKSEIPVSMKSSPEENIKIRSDLIALESRDRGTLEDSGIDEILPPEKQYTAFTNVETESGDFITTGRVFIAGEWSKPTSQYCYLAIPGMVGGTGLANVDGEGNLSISTEDPLLISFMRNYCRFE